MSLNVFAVILAGGAGTRFWPASRSLRPKQLLPLAGGDALLVQTVRRVLPIVGEMDGVMLATGRHIVEASRALLPDLLARNVLVEPVPRNTAPCIGLAAAHVARRDPDAVLMVLPSDHHIGDPDRFRAALERAVASAQRGVVTTIGIRPTHAETGYGYIEVEQAEPRDGAFEVRRFVEKPDRARAESFLAAGNFLWNAGMFFFRARDMMQALHAHQPALAAGVEDIARAGEPGSAGETEALDRVFPGLPSVSIDHGVIEHLKPLAVVPGDFGWSDLGSWQSAWELAVKDSGKNSSPPGAVLVDATGNHVVDLRTGASSKRVIALIGVHDLVVVETDDALLVVPRDRAQDVKAAVDALKQRGDGALT